MCVFCKIISKEIPSKIILETDHVLVVEDIFPKAPIHYLILSKKHIDNLMFIQADDASLLYETLNAAKILSSKLAEPQSFNLICNNGAGAGQSVFHLHWHFLAGTNIYQSKISL